MVRAPITLNSALMTLAEAQRELLRSLLQFKTAHDVLMHLVAQGKLAPALAPDHKTPTTKVEGCLSNLWVTAELREGRCYFQADADSAIVKGIAVLLCDLYSGHHPREIISLDPSFLAQAGITQHLNPNRRNALSRLWEKMREFASACVES